MGLSASMWTSVSGLLAHGNKMNVVGNNIANVSTIGFKGQRMDFNDYLYVSGGSTSGPTQIGAGVSTYAVLGDFSQGSIESTNSVTDLAIDGKGWFRVRQPNTEQMYYTRAGDFYFNADRQLQNPEGMRLQGWKIDSASQSLTFKRASVNVGANTANESAFQGTGTPKDIVLDSWYIEPKRTNSVSFTMGLTSDSLNDRALGDETAGPFLGLVNQWDASRLPDNPMPDKTYATQSSIKVYDESGISHELTVYYDQVSPTKNCEIANLPSGYSLYEYIVTISPEEDMRLTAEGKKFSDTKAGGLLMTGHMIFDASGNMVNQTAYTYQGSGETNIAPTKIEKDKNGQDQEVLNLGAWKSTQLSSNGLPVFAANFKGMENASAVDQAKVETSDQLIEIDFGLRFTSDLGNGTLAALQPQKATYTTGVTITNDITDTSEVEVGPADASGNKPKLNVLAKKTDNAGTITTTPITITEKINNIDVDCYIRADTKEVINPATGAVVRKATPAETTRSQNFTVLASTDGKPITTASGDYIQPDKKIIKRTDGSANGTAEDKDLYYTVSYGNLAVANENMTTISNNPTKAGGKSFVTQDAKANGYTSGVLSSTNITNDGVVYGYYDNGESLALYQISMYDFHNEQGLRREGGNLYAATKASGDPRQGVAGDNGFGVTRAYSIESSNVDLSREFVNMITTQRGFQANSKGITTVDTMLETVIGMKR